MDTSDALGEEVDQKSALADAFRHSTAVFFTMDTYAYKLSSLQAEAAERFAESAPTVPSDDPAT